MQKITREEFNMWRSDNVTKQMFEALALIRQDIESNMLDASTILGANAQVTLAKLCGNRELIDFVLNVDIEDIENEESQSSGL